MPVIPILIIFRFFDNFTDQTTIKKILVISIMVRLRIIH